MITKTLFLAWQDKREKSRLWFPVGRLDVNVARPRYAFGYTRGAKELKAKADLPRSMTFPPLIAAIPQIGSFLYLKIAS